MAAPVRLSNAIFVLHVLRHHDVGPNVRTYTSITAGSFSTLLECISYDSNTVANSSDKEYVQTLFYVSSWQAGTTF